MNNYIYEILENLEKNGYIAYIVGGFVRDKIIGNLSSDIDICTDATPAELSKIFNDYKTYEEYGSFKIRNKDFNIDITTFREEISYENNKPKIKFIKDLKKDLIRRDFTINSFCMDKNENIIDLLNAKKDLDNKLIKVIGNVSVRFKEDATRALRALRFMSVLDFKLEESIVNYLKNNKEIFERINAQYFRLELDKILASKNVKKFIEFIFINNLNDIFGFKENIAITKDLEAMYAQMKISERLPFSKKESTKIKKIKKYLNKGSIDEFDIYNLGLDLSLIIGGLLGVNSNEIKKIYTNSPINSKIDIDITYQDLIKIINVKDINKVYEILEKKIVNNNLTNKKESILKFLEEWVKEYGRNKKCNKE